MGTKPRTAGWSAIAMVLAIALIAGCGAETTPPAPNVEEPAVDATTPEAAEVSAPVEASAAKEEASASEGSASKKEKRACCASKPEGESAKCAGKCRPLFNGKDLTGWQNARNPEGENTWFIEDGAMTNVKAEGDHGVDLGTVDEFKDFCLHVEYKTIPGGNSGVYLRGRIEVQVFDSHGTTEVTAADAGAIFGKFVPLVNASKPAGEWHAIDACYVGDRLTVLLNGQLVQDNIQVAELTGGALPGGVNDAGPIMLQGDHGKVWYRNIRVCEVDPANPCCKPEDGAKTFEKCPMAKPGACPMTQGEGSATEVQSDAGFEVSVKKMLADFKAGMEGKDIDKLMRPISANFDHYEWGGKDSFRDFIADQMEQGMLDDAEIDFQSAEISKDGDVVTVYPVEMAAMAGALTLEFTVEEDDDGVWRVTSMEVEGI